MCFDQNQAFVFGYSAGGYMSHALACFRGDLFAGAGAISAGLGPGDCTGPKAIYSGHGETDNTVPFANGVAARDRWLVENGCGESTTPTEQEGCVAYEGCMEGAPLIWCTHPGAHSFFPWTADGAVQLFRNLPH
jgi:poly(3-hydroxybutyrate) depolymerase